jgi:Zn-dependent membrane protease YugP
MNKNIFETVCKAVALGMGVAVIVLTILGTLSVDTGMMLLGIGLTALALSGLEKLS